MTNGLTKLVQNFIDKHNLIEPTSSIGNSVTWKVKVDGGECMLNATLMDKPMKSLEEFGQLTVTLDIRLKQVYDFINYHNFGEDPRSSRWDKDDSYQNKIGEIASIGLCEYAVGNGGSLRIGKWVHQFEYKKDEMVNKTLSYYRNVVLQSIKKS